MAYNKKTWLARLGQGLNKFSIDGATPVPIINQPDSVTQQGDALSAGNLNDLEQRIADAFDDVEESKADKSTTDALQSQINQHESRLENLEQKAGDYGTWYYPNDPNHSSDMPNKVPTGKAKNGLVEKIVGKTRAWNQLLDNNRITSLPIGITYLGLVNYISGHKYLVIQKGTTVGYMQTDSEWPVATVYSLSSGALTGGIGTAQSSLISGAFFNNTGSQIQTGDFYFCIYDLTLIFGSGNEPSTVADALAQLSALGQYNAYDAGSLVDTVVSGVESRDTSDNLLDTLSLSETVTLKSAGSVPEVLTLETGKKTRPIGSVDLGSLDYTSQSTGTQKSYYSPVIDDIKKPSSDSAIANIICQIYVISSTSSFVNKGDCVIGVSSSGRININDNRYSDAIALKSALNGVYLYYELATPLSDEQVCDPIIDNFIEVEGGGTVETIQTQTPVIDNCLDVGYLTV